MQRLSQAWPMRSTSKHYRSAIITKCIGVFVLLLILMPAHVAASGWNEFANNLGSDLAPLLSLFGEQVTKQYLSESFDWTENLIFALAPLGIITAIVAAIRVGGSPEMRAVIGRATESRGSVEADLMSSTSSDVCELWNGEGVVRVLGEPMLLEVIYDPEGEMHPDKGLYTLEDAIKIDLFFPSSQTQDSENRETLLQVHPPNLSRNVSLKRHNRPTLIAVAVIGFSLQCVVLAYGSVLRYTSSISLPEGTQNGYGFPTFFVGTLFLTLGMYVCARVVDKSTTETTWQVCSPKPDLKVIWIQQGGQTVGDQLFEPFATVVSTQEIARSAKSDKKRNTSVLVAVTTSVLGFILQFIGLRGMHASVTIAQLGATLIMTILRAWLRMERKKSNQIEESDRRKGHELDWLAQNLKGVKTWDVRSGIRNPGYQRISGGDSGSLENLATETMQIRARLALLTGDWKKMKTRRAARCLKTAIEGAMNQVYTGQVTLKDEWNSAATFRWPVLVHSPPIGPDLQSLDPLLWQGVHLTLSRCVDQQNSGWMAWHIEESELEAVLSLWVFALKSGSARGSVRERSDNASIGSNVPEQQRWIRLLGAATQESIIDYNLWIFRETDPSCSPMAEFTSVLHNEDSGLEKEYFGWTDLGVRDAAAGSIHDKDSGLEGRDPGWTDPGAGDAAADNMHKVMWVGSHSTLEEACAQDIYGSFIFALKDVIGAVGGITERRETHTGGVAWDSTTVGERWNRIRLVNSNLKALADTFHDSGLGSIETAYMYIIPALRTVGKVPSPREAYLKASAVASALGEERWREASDIYCWMYGSARSSAESPWILRITEVWMGWFLLKSSQTLALAVSERPLSDESKKIHQERWGLISDQCRRLGFADENRVNTIINLYTVCEKIGVKTEPGQLWWKIMKAAEELDPDKRGTAKIFIKLARLAIDRNNLATAEILLARAWKIQLGIFGLGDGYSYEIRSLLSTIWQDPVPEPDPAPEPWRMEPLLAFWQRPGFEFTVQKYARLMTMADQLKLRGSSAASPLTMNTLDFHFGTGFDTPWYKFFGRTPLQEAAENGRQDLVEKLLRSGVSDNVPAAIFGGRTALQAAAAGGHTAIVQALLETGADSNARAAETGGVSALRAAAENGSQVIVKLLLEANADPNPLETIVTGRTALRAAAAKGYKGIVQLLLGTGANHHTLGENDIYLGIALRAAAGNGHYSIVRLLLDAKAKVDWATSRGSTALQVAAENGHNIIVKLLLDASADVNPPIPEDGAPTALVSAVRNGHEAIVQQLLGANADMWGSIARHGEGSALEIAAGAGHANLVLQFLELFKTHVDNPMMENIGMFALAAAIENGHNDIAFQLIAAGAGTGAWDGVSALVSRFGKRVPLQVAAAKGHAALAKQLLDLGADVNAPAPYHHGRTPLQAATEHGHEAIVKQLLAAGADVNGLPAENYGQTALQAAAVAGSEVLVQLLLQNGADVNTTPEGIGMRTALQAVAETGNGAILQQLLEAGADVNAPSNGYSGRTALQAAVEKGHINIVQQLLEAKADVNASAAESSEMTALEAAVEKGHDAILKQLIEAGVNLDVVRERTGSALRIAIRNKNENMVRVLLDAGSDVNIPAEENAGWTALQAAAEGGNVVIVRLLLGAGAYVNAPPGPSDGKTALQAAAENGHEAVVYELLEAKADVNTPATRRGGRTPLQAAAENGHQTIVQYLLASGANTNARGALKDGRTALQAAAERGHRTIVGLVIGAGADVNADATGEGGRTAMQAAAENGRGSIVTQLLDAGADVNFVIEIANHVRTTLREAAGNGHISVVQQLLKAGANANYRRHRGDKTLTALQAAAEGGHQIIVKLLLDAGADVNQPADSLGGFTALGAAAKEGHGIVVQQLLEAGADVKMKFGWSEKTALEAGRGRGHILEKLLKAEANAELSKRYKWDYRV